MSASDRTLVRCATEKVQRRPKQDKPRQLPSLLLSNVRSLNNKLDEVERRTVSLKPEILVLTETWLDESIPNSCISLSGYSICRNDRNRFGGGIIMYIADKLDYCVINTESESVISVCDSELLTVLFPSLKLIIIAIYHFLEGYRKK